MCAPPSSLRQVRRTNREPPNPSTGGSKDRIGYRRSNRGDTRLAAASRRLRTGNEVNLYGGRRIIHAQHFVIVEVALLDAPILDGNGALQGGREAKIDSAFHLRLHAAGVDSLATIDCADDSLYTQSPARSVTRSFCNLGHVTAVPKMSGNPAADAFWQRRPPTSLLRSNFDHVAATSYIDSAITAERDFSSRTQHGKP
jgi:hypothetical protein